MRGRAIGVALLCLAAMLGYFIYDGMAVRAVYSTLLLYVDACLASAGGVMIALGVGGIARVRDVPPTMWGALAIVSALLGLVVVIPLGRVLAWAAGFEDL